MANIASLNVMLTSSMEGLKSGLSKGAKLVEGFKDKLGKLGGGDGGLFKNMGGGIGKLGSSLGSLGGIAGGLMTALGPVAAVIAGGLGIAAGVSKFKAGITEASARLDILAKKSDVLNMAPQALRQIEFAGGSAGVDADVLHESLKEMQLKISEGMLDEADPANQIFKELSLNAKELSKLPVEEQFLAIADSMNNVAFAGDRIRFAEQIFGGDDGIKTMGLISQGVDKIRADMMEADQVMGKLSNADVAMNAIAKGAKFKLGSIFDGMFDKLAVAWAPVSALISDSLSTLAKPLADGLVWAGEKFFKLIAFTLERLKTTFSVIKVMLEPILDTIGPIFSGAVSILKDGIPMVFNPVFEFFGTTPSGFLDGLGDGIIRIMNIMHKGVIEFRMIANEIALVLVSAFDGIVNNITSVIPAALSKITGLAASALDKIPLMGDKADALKEMSEGFAKTAEDRKGDNDHTKYIREEIDALEEKRKAMEDGVLWGDKAKDAMLNGSKSSALDEYEKRAEEIAKIRDENLKIDPSQGKVDVALQTRADELVKMYEDPLEKIQRDKDEIDKLLADGLISPELAQRATAKLDDQMKKEQGLLTSEDIKNKAESLTDTYEDPFTKIRKETEEIDQLLAAGLISPETAQKATAKYAEEWKKAAGFTDEAQKKADELARKSSDLGKFEQVKFGDMAFDSPFDALPDQPRETMDLASTAAGVYGGRGAPTAGDFQMMSGLLERIARATENLTATQGITPARAF